MKKTVLKRERPGPLHNDPNILQYRSDESGREVENIKRIPADDLGKLTDLIRQRRTKRFARLSHGTASAAPVFSSEPLIAYKYDPGLGKQPGHMSWGS